MFKRSVHVFTGPDRPNPGTCKQILQLGDKYPIAETKVGFGEGGKSNADLRRSELRWIPPTEQTVTGLIWHYVNFANRESFGLDVNWLYEIQLTTYHGSNEGHYDWHQDTFLSSETPFQRKLSFIMQLSDPADYEGGDLLFSPNYVKGWTEKNYQEIKQQGTVIVFPSFVLHKVTPVTKGTRRSLVSWVEGPHWR